jgi:endonuclease I
MRYQHHSTTKIVLLLLVILGSTFPGLYAQTITSESNNTVLVAQADNSISSTQADYYANVYKLTGVALRTALHSLITGHTVISYDGLYTAFPTTDAKPNNIVWDIYSDIPGGTPAYTFTHGSKKCGSYKTEADCYNREHSWCDSWLGETNPARSDLFHMYPTDGYVNNRRSNYTFGTVSSPTWTSTNGSKLGPNTYPGFTGTVFEPINEYKGDLARSAFYMSTRYYKEDGSWSTSNGTNKSELLTWYSNLLYDWSVKDTVSTKEINRNNAIYTFQKNRNPFIDHPEFAAEIWKPTMAPSVVSVTLSGTNAVVIDFSRLLDSTTAKAVENYVSTVIPASVQWGVNNDYSKVLVTYSALASGTTYSLQLKNFKSINAIAMNDTTVSFRTSGTVGVNEQTKTPVSFGLKQNYPNPFNPSTEISFELREVSDVSLRVYDVLGNLVNEIANGRMSKGVHTITFHANGLSAGVYYYQLQAGNEAQTKKMILMK